MISPVHLPSSESFVLCLLFGANGVPLRFLTFNLAGGVRAVGDLDSRAGTVGDLDLSGRFAFPRSGVVCALAKSSSV